MINKMIVTSAPNNKVLKGSGRILDNGKGEPVKRYFARKNDCDNCPLRSKCLSAKAEIKKLQHSYYKPQLDAAKERAASVKVRRMKTKRL